VIILKNTCFF